MPVVKKYFLTWLPKEREMRLMQLCFVFLSVSLLIFFLTVLRPLTMQKGQEVPEYYRLYGYNQPSGKEIDEAELILKPSLQ